MKKAYIILAHKNPEQLARLITALDDGNSTIFVHIDRKVSFEPFEVLRTLGSKVHLVERVVSKWGSIGAVDATLNGMKAVLQSGTAFERIILMSGQDYPIKSGSYIDNFFRAAEHSVFLDYFPLPNHEKWKADKGGMYRVNKYFFGLEPYKLFASRALNLLATFFPFLSRKIPGNMKPFAGSQWWILDMYALKYILNYVEKNPAYRRFHCNTFASDELFFHMILANSKDTRIQQSISRDSKRFMKWQTSWIAHPEILTTNDLDDINASDALYARKFDFEKDKEVFDLLDRQRLKAGVAQLAKNFANPT